MKLVIDMNTFIGLMIPFLGTALGAALVFLMKDKMNPKIEKILLGFASGVMIAAAIWSLMLPSIDLAEKLGYADKSMISKIEKGLVDLPQSKILAFAEVLKVTPGELMGLDNTVSHSEPRSIPIKVYERVASGIPLEAADHIIDTEEISEDMARSGKFFGLRVKGDSMTPDICDGDTVIVRQQDDAETGDIVIATINGNEATCRRLRKYKDGIELISINPSYDTFDFNNEEIFQKPVKIIGKVVESRRRF